MGSSAAQDMSDTDRAFQIHKWRRFAWDTLSAQSSNHWTPHMHNYGRESNFRPAKFFEMGMMSLILLNSAIVVMDTVRFSKCGSVDGFQQTWDSFYTCFEVRARVLRLPSRSHHRSRGHSL